MFENKQELQEYLNNNADKIIIMLFTATWCGPCKYAKPIIKEHLENNPEYVYIEIDYDEYNHFTSLMRVKSIPSMFAFIKGQREVVCLNSNKHHIDRFFDEIKQHVESNN